MAGQGSLCQPVRSAPRQVLAARSGFAFSTLALIACLACSGEAARGEPLQIQIVSTHPFAAPNSILTVTASGDPLVEHASQRLQLRTSLYRVATGDQVATDRRTIAVDPQGNFPAETVELTLPAEIGVYEVRGELTKDDEGLWNRLRRKSATLSRTGRPLIVVDSLADSAPPHANSSRRALLDLPNLDWITVFEPPDRAPAGLDPEGWVGWDPHTQTSARLWSASGQLSRYLQQHQLSGVTLPTDDRLNRAGGETHLLAQIGSTENPLPWVQTVARILRQQGIRVSVGQPEPSKLVSLRHAWRGLPDPPPATAHRTEFDLAAALAGEEVFSLVLDHPIAAGPLNHSAIDLLGKFTALPPTPLVPIPSTDPSARSAVVRGGIHENHGYLMLLSLAPWTTDLELKFAASAAPSISTWNLVTPTSSDSEASDPGRLSATAGEPNQIRVQLLPGQLAVLKSVTPIDRVGLESWTATIQGGADELRKIKADVTSIVQRIGLLTDLESSVSLTNGGFEQAGDIGIVGWMHAQHPPGCVAIDKHERVEGERSIVLSTTPTVSTRTWIVSEPIQPRTATRLAVSMAIRAALDEGDNPHQMRVSLESAGGEQPVRYSNDFEVPRNGQWSARRMVLEIDDIDPHAIDALRLTIDSISGGRVWLDDIRIHRWFATAKEREKLHSQAFLAVQGLQHGDLSPSARLLKNPWARYLLTRPANRPSEPGGPTVEAELPGVAQRIRQWLPEPIRF